MATFVTVPVRFGNVIHLDTSSVWERTSKFADCGTKIPVDAEYLPGNDPATCAACLTVAARTKAKQERS